MWKDPIVEEIHIIREQIARECNYDLKLIMDRLRQKEVGHTGTGRVVYECPMRRESVCEDDKGD